MTVLQKLKIMIADLASRPVTESLAKPFSVIRHGHIWYLSYTLGLVALASLLLSEMESRAQQWLALVFLETPLGLGAFQTVTAAADAIIWGLAAPVILTAAALPVRAIFNFRRIDLNLLLKASPAELVDALRSLLITGFSAVYAAAPAALVLLGYFFWAKDQSVTSLRQIYLLTCAAICIITLARSLPVYFAPFVTICGGYGPREGLFLTNRILGPRRIALAVMLAGWTLCSWAVYIALPFSTASIVIQAAAAWYALTYISIYVMRAVAEFEEQRLPRPKPAGLRKGTHKAPPHEPEYFSVENVHMVH